ncbi:MAG TPA: Crp/Fnr family transcriptional regulator [Armatimonadota bacterium]
MTEPVDEIRGAIEAATSLGPLTEADAYELARMATVAESARGESIWLSGARADFFGLVLSGFVKMVKGTPAGQGVTAEIIGPGQVFGMLGVVDGKGCPLMAQAVTAARYVRIPKSVFQPLYARNSAVREHIAVRSTSRLRQAFDTMALMSTGRVEQRLAAVLFTLAEPYGRNAPDGLLIEVPLTRQDMADLAGATVETTIRTLSRWQSQGLVRTDHRRVTILAEKALAALLEG